MLSDRCRNSVLVMFTLAAAACGDAGAENVELAVVPAAGSSSTVTSTSTVTAGGGTGAAGGGVAAARGGSSGFAGPKANADGTVMRGTGPATFTRVWEEVLMPKGCAGAYCHGSAVGGLKLMKREDAYAVLVGVMAGGPECGSSGKMRVKPGDPDASLLLEKMSQAKPSCGDAMPIGTKLEPNCVSMNTSVCNTQADLMLVREWIMAGAKND